MTIVDRPGASPGPAAGRLADDLRRVVATGGGTAGLVATTVAAPAIDPIALFAACRELDLETALWLQPSEGFALVGIGRAWVTAPQGADRFERAAGAWASLVAGLQPSLGERPRGAGPVLLGGLGFDGRLPADPAWSPFGAASLVLPELAFARTPGGSFVTATIAGAAPGDARDEAAASLGRTWDGLAARAAQLAPAPGAVAAAPVVGDLAVVGEQPDQARWELTVGMYAGAVGRGRLDKVVLARRVDVVAQAELDAAHALRRLAVTAPESTLYAFTRDGRIFLGATPERLVRTTGRDFETVAVAGSIRRGADAAEDAVLAARLVADEKELEEHGVVVAMLRASLGPLVDELQVGAAPTVLRLRHVQHLVTPVTGRLRERAGILALAGVLHPTPAVGGEPRELALDLIDEHEGFERGWYSGPVGWLGTDGDGEMAVALRCANLAGRSAVLFAGCGIVADSDPGREWEESRDKLRTIASALGRLDR